MMVLAIITDMKKKKTTGESPPDLEVSPEVEYELTVLSAIDCIENGDLTWIEAVRVYNIKAEDLAKYKPLWDEPNTPDESL